MLRTSLEDKIIIDKDGSLINALEDISSLEKSLLQANADAMQIASRIIKVVESGTNINNTA